MSNEKRPIACDLTVFSEATREEIAASTPVLFDKVQKVQELPDGYALQFPNEPGIVMELAHFVEHERQCCPFYRFLLQLEPDGGPVWLHLAGGEEVKQFMQVAWNDLEGAVSQEFVKTGSSEDLDDAIAEAAPLLAESLQKAEPRS